MYYEFKVDDLHAYRTRVLASEICREMYDGAILAGGSLRTILNTSDPIADYDIFFTSEEAKQRTIKLFDEWAGGRRIFTCPLGELYSYSIPVSLGKTTLFGKTKMQNVKVQLITKFIYKDVEKLLTSFDIDAGRAAYYMDKVYLNKDFIKNVRKKKITIGEVTFPVATISRLMKYRAKGYKVPGETIKNLVLQISEGEWDGDQLQLYLD